MSNFSFPDTPIILKGTVNDNGKYLTTHKLVCKNLKIPLHNYNLFFYQFYFSKASCKYISKRSQHKRHFINGRCRSAVLTFTHCNNDVDICFLKTPLLHLGAREIKSILKNQFNLEPLHYIYLTNNIMNSLTFPLS